MDKLSVKIPPGAKSSSAIAASAVVTSQKQIGLNEVRAGALRHRLKARISGCAALQQILLYDNMLRLVVPDALNFF